MPPQTGRGLPERVANGGVRVTGFRGGFFATPQLHAPRWHGSSVHENNNETSVVLPMWVGHPGGERPDLGKHVSCVGPHIIGLEVQLRVATVVEGPVFKGFVLPVDWASSRRWQAQC